MPASYDVDFCIVEIDIWGVRHDFVERGCGYFVLRQDEGCYDDTAVVSPVYSWNAYVSGQTGQRH